MDNFIFTIFQLSPIIFIIMFIRACLKDAKKKEIDKINKETRKHNESMKMQAELIKAIREKGDK